MKKSYLHLILAALLCGCSDNSPVPSPSTDGEADGYIEVTLRVPLSESSVITRSYPTGGEDGDGREQGILNENEVYDVNVFFYQGTGLNPANPTEVPVTGLFVSDMSSAFVTTEELPNERLITITINPNEANLESAGIINSSTSVSFITVLNAGKDLSGKISNLNDLRGYTGLSATWTQEDQSTNASDFDHFIMTTVSEAPLLETTETNTIEDSRKIVWKGSTTVQRMCARIDVMYQEENISIDELRYNLIDQAYEDGSIVHIQNILPVNVMSEPSYLLPLHTEGLPIGWSSDEIFGSIKWGIEQTTATNPSDRPTNYVLEPHTLSKEQNPIVATLEKWYGSTTTKQSRIDISEAKKGRIPDYWSGTLKKTDPSGCKNITIIGYANENTQSPEQFKSKYMTGLAFRAVYQPRNWTIHDDVEEGWSTMLKTDDDWEAMSDKGFTRYQPQTSQLEKDALYFASHEDAKKYSEAHPEDHAILTRFEGGVCYYNLWLRHYNDEKADPQENYPMEYAIVRNNIYRVAISFNGPGDPTPTMREPDTMQSRIYVVKWNFRPQPEIIM